MKRVFPRFEFRNARPAKWEKLVHLHTLILGFVIFLTGTAPLTAQSGADFPFSPQAFRLGRNSGNVDDLGRRESGWLRSIEPLSLQERRSIVGSPDLARSESSSLDSSLNFEKTCADVPCRAWFGSEQESSTASPPSPVQSGDAGSARDDSKLSSGVTGRYPKRPDFNEDIYYRNRLEFGLEVGWHPINIPFVYDFAVGDAYTMTPLKYTLVPIMASLRWHVTNIGWPWILRGNFDFVFSGSVTAIPRGPESRYYSFVFGIRRNFVYRNWKVVPYFDERGGIGNIDAKEPLGVLWAQGQNLTFTYNMGAGVRYNLDSKYSFSAGMNYMHISNGYLSEPQFLNYGINVYGPLFGMTVRLGKPRHHNPE